MARKKLDAEMHRHALAAAEMVREEYGHELDFSEATIGGVEALLNGFWEEKQQSEAIFPKIALLFGAYIGELVRKVYTEAMWEPAPPDLEAGSPHIVLRDVQIFPITWCYKRLYNGPADCVVTKYLAFRQAIEKRFS